jgi:DNA repair exonuclease SbcCD ATPase subunit
MVMAIAEDMKKLTENIIISNDVRLRTVGELVAETHKSLEGFAGDRKKMAAEQAKDLANFVNELSKKVQSFLGEFQKDHQQMSKEQAKDLSDSVKNLAKHVGSMLSTFEKDRTKMSKELKDRLAKEIKDIQTEVERILDEADKLIGEFSSDMAEARKAWKDMSARLSKARKAGFVGPKSEAKGKETKVGPEITGSKSRKKAAKGSKVSKETVHVAY